MNVNITANITTVQCESAEIQSKTQGQNFRNNTSTENLQTTKLLLGNTLTEPDSMNYNLT